MDRITCSVCADERCQQNNNFIEYIYVLTDSAFAQIVLDHQIAQCEDHMKCFLSIPPHSHKPSKYNRQQLTGVCKFMGVKEHDAVCITNQIFILISNLTISKKKIRDGQNYQIIHAVTLNSSKFEEIVLEAFVTKGYLGNQHLIDFHIACQVITKKKPVIVLLGGASGTGKSTLSSLLASRLGISSLLSTDSIRHILRNILNKDENQVLFCSTYEAGNFIDSTSLSHKEACIKGYLEQCNKVYEYLDNLIESYHRCGISIVIEGVHLHVGIMKRLMMKYNSCIPFTIMIKNKQKHMERFAVRSKYMTLDPKLNKYTASFPNIREIQKRFAEKSEKHGIPMIETSNLDRSFGLCHATIIRCLRQVYKGIPIYDRIKKQTAIVQAEFKYVSKIIWTSKIAHEIIKSKVNKGELFKRFFGAPVEDEADIIDELNVKSEGSSLEAPDIGSIASGQELDISEAKGITETEAKDFIQIINGEDLFDENQINKSDVSDTDSDRSIEGDDIPAQMLSESLLSVNLISHTRQKSV